jgi:hypothetical protein
MRIVLILMTASATCREQNSVGFAGSRPKFVDTNPNHWFVIQCSDAELTVLKWNSDTANAPGARHFCGEAHAQVYISRWFESICSPPKPDFAKPVHYHNDL